MYYELSIHGLLNPHISKELVPLVCLFLDGETKVQKRGVPYSGPPIIRSSRLLRIAEVCGCGREEGKYNLNGSLWLDGKQARMLDSFSESNLGSMQMN